MSSQATTHVKHANQLFTSKIGSKSQDFTSIHTPLDSYINTHLTDEEILQGDPKLITQERILQVSTTHTAEEIASKVNTPDKPHALTPKLVYHRIHTACHSVASKNNTSFNMVKLALNNARIESGVKARINATLGRATAAETPSYDVVAPAAGKKVNEKGSDASQALTEVDDTTTSYLGDFFSTDSTMRAANPLFKRIAKGGSKLPENEDLIRLAAKYTVMEMVQMVQDADPTTTITNTKISARIMDALSLFATARALPRDVVKKEFEIAKQANGVVARHYEKISTKRKATTKARKEVVKRETGAKVVSLKMQGKKKRASPEAELSIEGDQQEDDDDLDLAPMQWTAGTREAVTPSPEPASEEDTPMTDSDDETVAWLDSPTYAKYKPATPESDIYSADYEMEDETKEECLTREQAANVLLEMRWLSEPELTDEGAALILMKLHAEAQDIQMGMPADLND